MTLRSAVNVRRQRDRDGVSLADVAHGDDIFASSQRRSEAVGSCYLPVRSFAFGEIGVAEVGLDEVGVAEFCLPGFEQVGSRLSEL
jgi:hypothetical protein